MSGSGSGSGSGNLFTPASVTSSGRPVLLQNEVECSLLSNVDLEPDETDFNSFVPLKSGILILTTHRLFFLSAAKSITIPLSAISHIFPRKKSIKSMFHSPRIRFEVSVTRDNRILDSGSNLVAGSRSVVVVVVVREKEDWEVFMEKFMENWRGRAWESVSGSGSSSVSGRESSGMYGSDGSVRMVGLAGILRKEQEMWESTDKSLQDAFQDLNALMSKAKEMVLLAEKMRQKLLSGSNSQSNSTNEDEMGSKEEMQDWLLSVGIISPVTKESAGAMYHQQLSRQKEFLFMRIFRRAKVLCVSKGLQANKPAKCLYFEYCGLIIELLMGHSMNFNDEEIEDLVAFCCMVNNIVLADFVRVPVDRAGGMINLIDIYCLFNRARGTELISPDDLLQACSLWEKFDVPVMLRKFDSGVMVIQSKSYSDDEVFARLNILVTKPEALQTGVSASDASIMLGIAPALAKEHLLTAESKGLLCRDISPDGFRFYINLFREISVDDLYLVKDYGLYNTWARAVSIS